MPDFHDRAYEARILVRAAERLAAAAHEREPSDYLEEITMILGQALDLLNAGLQPTSPEAMPKPEEQPSSQYVPTYARLSEESRMRVLEQAEKILNSRGRSLNDLAMMDDPQ